MLGQEPSGQPAAMGNKDKGDPHASGESGDLAKGQAHRGGLAKCLILISMLKKIMQPVDGRGDQWDTL